MIEIDTCLLLGNALEIRDARKLFAANVAAVVDVATEESSATPPREMIYLRVPLNDGGGNSPTQLRLALRSLNSLLSAGIRSIVACSAGLSRSPTLAAFALAQHHGESPADVLARIAAVKLVQVHPLLWNDFSAITSGPPA